MTVPRRSTRSRTDDESAVRAGVRRDELVDVAARVFAAKGYGNTSIRDIADAVGLLKGSLYHYIDTKEDLLFEVIRSTLGRWQALVVTTQDSPASTLNRLASYVQSNIEGSLNSRDHTAVFNNDFQALSAERQQVILNLRQEHDRLLRELIETAKTEKLVAADIDVKIVSLAILTMSGSLYRWYKPTGKMSARNIARQLTAFVLRGLGVAEKHVREVMA